MGEVELRMEAREDTMAAASAATTRPFNPAGTKRSISQGAALSLTTLSPLRKLGSREAFTNSGSAGLMMRAGVASLIFLIVLGGFFLFFLRF